MEYIKKCVNGVISSFDLTYRGSIEIPLKCGDNIDIVKINYNAGSYSNFTSIDMSNTKIETIMYNAFLHADYLTDVKLPPTLKIIDANTFGCTPLTSIILPSTLTLINGAFNKCFRLNFISVEEGNTYFVSESNCIFSCNFSILYTVGSNLKFNNIPHMDMIEQIDFYCFSGRNIDKFIATSNLKSLISHAFHGASRMKFCDLSLSNVTVLPLNCFWSLNSIEKIVLPSSLVEMKSGSIRACPKLKFFIIPESVSSIVQSAFTELELLTDVFYYGTSFIDNDCFNGYNVRVHVTTLYTNENLRNSLLFMMLQMH